MDDEVIGSLLKDILRKVDRLERISMDQRSALSYVVEAVRLRVGTDVNDSPLALLSGALSLDVSGDFNGLSWYYSEIDKGSNFRWSGPGLLSTIYLSLARDQPLRCRILVGRFAPEVPRELSVFVDGTLVLSFPRVVDTIEFVIPTARLLRSTTEIGLLTSKVTQPESNGSSEPDLRWLGFQLLGLETFPDTKEQECD